MKLYTSISLIFLFSLALNFSVYAQNSSEEIRQLLEERDQQIKELVGPKGTEYTQEQRDELKDIINGIVDYEAMGSYALGDTFQEITEEEQERFVDLFSTVIRDQSLNRLDIYRADVQYNDIEVSNGAARVDLTAQLEDTRTPVIYDMEYDEQREEWMIVDMEIDDVSTADSYRRQFGNMLQKGGFELVMERLEKRAAR